MDEHLYSTESEQERTVREKTRLDFWTLKFTDEYKELEKHFLVSFYTDSLNKVRFALILAVIFYALFGILDVMLIPEYKYKMWTIRYLIVIPLLLSVLALSFTRVFKKKIQFISANVVLLSGIGVIIIIWLAPVELSNYYFPGLILILLMNYGFLRLRFIWASSVGLLVSISYIIAAFDFIEMPYLQCVFNSFFLFALNVVGVFVSREFEVHARREYFWNQLLKIERMKLKTLNARMEAKIKERANQLKEILEDNNKVQNEVNPD